MLDNLLGEVVDGDGYASHTVVDERVDISVDYCASAYFEQWLGSGEGKGAEAFAFSASHEHGVNGEGRAVFGEVDNVDNVAVAVENWNERN